MERLKSKFKCEVCSKDFWAANRRGQFHCKKCAELLRDQGRGPRQPNRKAEAGAPTAVRGEATLLDWSRAGEDLLYYLKRFRKTVERYDAASPEEMDKITDGDRRLANLVAARMGERTWAPLVSESIRGIGDWDLLSMSDSNWEVRREAVRGVLAKLLNHPGIGAARLTKGLHRKRPELIPVCDSILRQALDVDSSDKADQIVLCLERLRAEGRANLDTIDDLRTLSKSKGIALTRLRILELLYWVQFGPFPPEQWRQSGG